MLNKRQRDKGFSKSKNGPVILDKVNFAFYLKKKYGFLLKPDGMWLKYSKGAFREITEREVLAIAMNEIVTDFPECYSISAEKTYLGALENLCFCKKKLNSHKNLINEFINWANDNKYIYLAKVTQKKFWQEFKATAKKMCGSSLKEGKSNKYRYITNIRLKNEVGNCVYKYYKIRNTPVKSNTIDLSEGNSYEDDEE